MLVNTSMNNVADVKQLFVWAVSIVIFLFGFRLIKDVFVWVLDELYRMLIQNQG